MPTIIACRRGRGGCPKAYLAPKWKGNDQAPKPSNTDRRVRMARAPSCTGPSAVFDLDPAQHLIDLGLRILGSISQRQRFAPSAPVSIDIGRGIAVLDQVAAYSPGALERQFEVILVRTIQISVPDDSDARVALLTEQSRHLGSVLLAK